MSIMSRCPACTSALRVPDGLGNRAARCPKCGEIFYPGRQASSPNSESVRTIAPEPQRAANQRNQLDDEIVSDDFEVVDDADQTDDDVPSDNFEVINDDPIQSEEPRDEAPRKRLLADDDESAAALLGPRKKRAKDDDGEPERDRPRKKSASKTDDNSEPERDRPRKKSANNDDGSEPDPDRPRKKKGKKSRRQEGKFNWTTIVIGAGVIITIGVITGMVFAVRAFLDDAIPAERWKTFEAPGRFKVSIPGTPEQKPQTIGPVSMVVYMYEYDLNTGFFMGHSEGPLPPQRRALGIEGILNDSCEGLLKNTEKEGAVEIKRESISHGPYPGKVLVVNVKKRKVNVVARIFLVGERVYLLMAVGRKYDEDNVNVKKFFDSFELLENPPPLQLEKK